MRRLLLLFPTLVAALILSIGVPIGARGEDTFSWRTNDNRVTADIRSGDLIGVLEQVAAATGWKVYVEPQTAHRVSAKFKDLGPGPALRMLLGDVNFALVPANDTNPRSRLYVFRTSAGHATQLVSGDALAAKKAAPVTIIGNELLVRLKPGAKIEDIARALGATVIGKIDGLNAYRLRFDDIASSEKAKEQLTSNPDVASVENNVVIDRPEVPSQPSGGPSSPPMLQMKDPPASGRVIVGLVDTGVQSLGSTLDQFLMKEVSIAAGGTLDLSSPSHGTAMAETILRALEQATGGKTSVQILPVDVFGGNKNTTTFDTVNGATAAYNGGAKVINMSLGSAADSPLMKQFVDTLVSKGVLVIGAKGNEPVTTPFYPASYPGVIAVAALDPNGQLTSYSNRSPGPSVGAPGSSLVSYNGQTWVVTGTSPAAADVSGIAAGYMDKNQVSTGDAKTYIQNTMGLKK
jgi:hypothetical protein